MNIRNLGLLAGLILTTALLFYAVSRTNNRTENDLPIIAITQIATHPALDEVREGILTGLAENGYKDGDTVRIVFRNANGDPSLTSPIAQEFARMSPAVVVPISTPSSLAVAAEISNVPIVFSGVTDPIGVGIVDSLEGSGSNITGVSDRWPFRIQVETFLDLFPDRRKIGLIYTRGDDVSAIGVRELSELADELGFELETRPVATSADIYPTASSLLQSVDAIYVGIDHLVLENMTGLVKAAGEARKPLFGGESGSVEMGAVMAVSINMSDFGRLTADLVIEVLEGRDPGLIPIVTVSEGDLILNERVAQFYGLDIEGLVLEGAKLVAEMD